SPNVVTPGKQNKGRVIPPLPDFVAPQPLEPMPEQNNTSGQYVPSNLGFTAPEHRGKLPTSDQSGPILIDPSPQNE
ncbi:MAG: hypothetical protein P8M30_20895, partial [Planctomycetaceae bacterium]|nr:hypothetical protein [Planctomycetaceae bacterium]